jgi:hypothetical protein
MKAIMGSLGVKMSPTKALFRVAYEKNAVCAQHFAGQPTFGTRTTPGTL